MNPFASPQEFHALHDAIGVIGHGTIWTWLQQYGLAAVLQVLPILLSGTAKNLTVAQMVAWGEAALQAVAAGLPLPAGPPLP